MSCTNCHYFEDTGIPFCSRFRFYVEPEAVCNYFDRWTKDRQDSEKEMDKRRGKVGYKKENSDCE
jgi:hypothetical protein